MPLQNSLKKSPNRLFIDPGVGLSQPQKKRKMLIIRAKLEVQINAMEATELRILGSLSAGQNVGPEFLFYQKTEKNTFR